MDTRLGELEARVAALEARCEAMAMRAAQSDSMMNSLYAMARDSLSKLVRLRRFDEAAGRDTSWWFGEAPTPRSPPRSPVQRPGA